MLSPQDQATVTEAVTRAEASTSGEIVCVIAARVSTYRETPLAWAAAAALALPVALVAAGLDPSTLLRWPGSWAVSNADSRGALTSAFAAYALLQVAIFALTWLLATLPPVRRVLTPPGLKHRRVSQAALAQLAAATLSAGPDRAAVVIFASQDDRIVEVVASPALHQAAGGAVWKDAVAAAQAGLRQDAAGQGLAEAVAIIGAALARHFPGDGADANARPDAPLQV